MFKVKVMSEHGFKEALLGLGLSFGATSDVRDTEDFSAHLLDKMYHRGVKLAPLDGGHNKFLESMTVYLDVTAPLYWWKEADTYRIGSTKQSESTMHTLMERPLTKNDFTEDVCQEVVDVVNKFIEAGDFEKANANLPQGFLQRRVWVVNYKTLRNIHSQRKAHKLAEWRDFCKVILEELEYPLFIINND